MTDALIALGLVSAAELCLFMPHLRRVRRWLAAVVAVALAFISGFLFMLHITLAAALVLYISLFRLFNLLRVVQNRLESHRLQASTRRTSVVLILYQGAALLMWAAAWQWHVVALSGWWALASLQLLGAGVLLASTWRHRRTTRPLATTQHYTDKELPTLTVAIPARNETDTLEACLQSLIASDYPKLEILVLDDCSQDRTAEIIRSFAHDGVRFVAGDEPRDGWLAKNQAYQRLFEESNGEIVLFCGVDTRFEPGSLRGLVTTLLEKHKEMLTVLPRNVVPTAWQRAAVLLVQPMRYAWELALPRRWLQRPPVLSTCWLIRRELLVKAGSFKAVRRSISPESHFARAAIALGDGYSFVQTPAAAEVSSDKSPVDQLQTAVRVSYPQTHRRPEIVLLVVLLELGGLVLPFIVLIGSLVAAQWGLAVVSGLSSFGLLIVYGQITAITYRRPLLIGWGLLPFAALCDIGLRHYSLWCYEFSEVIWKGRNVCIPVMQVIPRLPKA